MAIRTDILTVDWAASPRIVWIDITVTELSVQDLYDTLRHYEASHEGIDEPYICDAGGWEPLGGGIYNGLTVTLFNAQYAFADRPGPDWVICNMTGGNVVSFYDYERLLPLYPRYPTAYVSADRTASASATTQEQAAIQYGSYDRAVHVEMGNGNSSVDYPAGSMLERVGDLATAMTIAQTVGLGAIQAYGDMTIDNGGDYRGMVFFGESPTKTVFDISAAAQVDECEFYEATVKGTLDADATVRGCVIKDSLNYVNGYLIECILESGVITLGGGIEAHLIRCVGGEAGTMPPEVHCGGSGQNLIIEDFHGRAKITNKTGPEIIEIGLSSGSIRLDLTTVTNGTLTISGNGHLLDDATGEPIFSGTYAGLTVYNKLTNVENIWNAAIDAGFTAEQTMRLMSSVLLGEVTGAGTGIETFYGLDGSTPRVVSTVDLNGNREEVTYNALP